MIDSITPHTSTRFFPTTSASSGTDELELVAERSKAGKQLTQEEITKVGQQFESVLLHQLLTTMRRSVPESGLFPNNSADAMYKDLFDQHIAEEIARSGQSGLAQAIVEEILKQQTQVSPSSQEPRMLPLNKPDNLFLPVTKSSTLQPLPQKGQHYFPLNEKNAGYLPIINNREKSDKINIAG
jgi:flagellar protein FlgJ